MGVPLAQQLRVGRYLLGRALKAERRYPLVLMLEPLYRCNLACPGCGKIAQPESVLARRLSSAECVAAVEECVSGRALEFHSRDGWTEVTIPGVRDHLIVRFGRA